MQPNQNMPGAGQAMGPTRPVASAGPAKPVNPMSPVNPVKPAEPAGGPTFDNGPSVVEGKGGKKTGWILGIVLCLILAAGGIGFGVWAYMDGNVQKDALNAQISSLKQQNNSLQEQLDNGGAITDGDIDVAEYIYLGDWGVKVKVGSDLKLFDLTHYNGEDGDTYSMIVVYPDQISAISDKYGTAIDNGDSFPRNFITRSKEAVYNSWGNSDPEYDLEPVYNDGEYNYFVYQSSGAILVNMGDSADSIIEAAGSMAEVLNNSENYSNI